MKTHGNLLDCSVDELVEVAAAAASYRDSPSGSDTQMVHVRLFMPRDPNTGQINYRTGTILVTDAQRVLEAFDPTGSIRQSSNEHSVAHRSYYRSLTTSRR